MEKVQISKNLVGSPLLADILQGKKRVKMETKVLQERYATIKKRLQSCVAAEKPGLLLILVGLSCELDKRIKHIVLRGVK